MSILIACPALAGPAPSTTLEIHISGLRNNRGIVHICVSPSAESFPQCTHKDRVRTLSVPAKDGHDVTIADLPPGTYAVSLIHDENGNGRLDTLLGIPREGFAFSNNPPILTGPPSFTRASVNLSGARHRERLVVKYVL